jgi:fucose permease
MQRPFVLALGFMMIFGGLDSVKGLFLPYLQKDLGLSYSEAGFIMSSTNIGFLVSSFFSGLLVDRLGIRKVFLFGVGLFLCSLLGFGMSGTFLLLVFFFIVVGLGAGSMEIGMNALIPIYYPNEQSKYFSFLHGFYGIGGIVFPILAGWLLVYGMQWNEWYIGFSILLLAAFLLLYRTPLPQKAEVETMDKAELVSLLKSPLFITYIFLISLYVASEVGLGAYLPMYLIEVRGLTTGKAALLLSLFFVFFSAGRLWGGIWVERWGSIRTLMCFSLIGSTLLAVGLWDKTWTVWLFPLSGLMFSIIFPTIASMVSQSFPKRVGTALGFLFTAAGMGGLLSVWLIGVAMDHLGVFRAFTAVLWLLVIVFIGSWVLRALLQRAD